MSETFTFPEIPDNATPLQIAHAYAEAGIRTFPVEGKVPCTGDGFLSATLDPDSLGEAWATATGVGIVPGFVKFGGRVLIALDLDGPEQIAAATEWLGERGIDVYSDTVGTRSGRPDGGTHSYLSVPAEVGEAFTSGEIEIGGVRVLIRGTGGYVVGVGSAYPTLVDDEATYDGTTYEYVCDVRTVAEAPDELVEMLTAASTASGTASAPEDVAKWTRRNAKRVAKLQRDHRSLVTRGEAEIAKRADEIRGITGSRHDPARGIVYKLIGDIADGYVTADLDHAEAVLREAFLSVPSTSGSTAKGSEREWSRQWDQALAKHAAAGLAMLKRRKREAKWSERLIASLPLVDEAEDYTPEDPWAPVDLAAVRAAGLDPIRPDLIRRTDGKPLIYTRKLSVLFGAPEAGKSLVAALFVAELLADIDADGFTSLTMGEPFDPTRHGVVAVYIDFEDDARTYLTRLQAAEVDLDLAETHTRYYSARRALSTMEALDGFDTAKLVIVDTTNAAMAIDDKDPLSNSDALQWIESLKVVRRLAPQAAWLVIDHEPISADGSRRQAIGAQAKFGAVDGVQYRVTAPQQPRPGHEGTINLHTTKDRPGGVREISAAPEDGSAIQHTATISIKPTTPGCFEATIYAPTGKAAATKRTEVLAEFDKALGSKTEAQQWLSANQIRQLVGGRGVTIDKIVKALYADDEIEAKPKASGVAYRRVHKPLSGFAGGPPAQTGGGT